MQTLLPGRDARPLLADAGKRAGFTTAAMTAISELHRCTGELRPVDDQLLSRHVLAPAELVRAAAGRRHAAQVDRLVAELTSALRGRSLPVGWLHGDYNADNVLVDADGTVTGIVDWGQAGEEGLVLLDVMCLLLATEAAGRGVELGAVVTAWTATEAAAVTSVPEVATAYLRRWDGDTVPARALVLLGWLHMVAANLAKSARYAANPIWMRRNVIPVLRALASQPGEQ